MGQKQSRPGVDREWVKKTSKLSRIRLTEEEISEILPQLGQILEHVDQLRAMNTDGVEPYVHPLFELLPESAEQSLRSDLVRKFNAESSETSALLNCAPEVTEGAFQVPQAVTQSGSRLK